MDKIKYDKNFNKIGNGKDYFIKYKSNEEINEIINRNNSSLDWDRDKIPPRVINPLENAVYTNDIAYANKLLTRHKLEDDVELIAYDFGNDNNIENITIYYGSFKNPLATSLEYKLIEEYIKNNIIKTFSYNKVKYVGYDFSKERDFLIREPYVKVYLKNADYEKKLGKVVCEKVDELRNDNIYGLSLKIKKGEVKGFNVYWE